VDAYIPTPVRAVDKPFLMSVEDVFTITGRGTVATGRVEQGKIKVSEEVERVGLGESKKFVVTGVEMFRKLLDEAQAGDNVGLLLRGAEKQDIERGQCAHNEWVSKDGSAEPGRQRGERRFRKQLRGHTHREREQFADGVMDESLCDRITLAGKAEDRGREGGDRAVRVRVIVEETRHGGSVGGFSQFSVIAHGRANTRCRRPALQFEQTVGDGAPTQIVTTASIAETPADAASIVD
jgi:hypothetical protein